MRQNGRSDALRSMCIRSEVVGVTGQRPRLSVTLEADVYETIQRVALVQGVSMSSVVQGLAREMEPGLRRVAELGEAMAAASASQRESIRRAIARTDEELAVPLADALGVSLEVLRRIDAVGADEGHQERRDPPGSNQGGKVLRLGAKSKRRSRVNPLVDRG